MFFFFLLLLFLLFFFFEKVLEVRLFAHVPFSELFGVMRCVVGVAAVDDDRGCCRG